MAIDRILSGDAQSPSSSSSNYASGENYRSNPIFRGGYRERQEVLNAGLINSSARDTMAAVNRRTWEDYIKRGVPIEDSLITDYRNPELWEQELGNANNEVNLAYTLNEGTQQRNVARNGITLTADQADAQSNAFKHNRSLSLVAAQTATRQGLDDRDTAILTGGLTTGGTIKKQEETA